MTTTTPTIHGGVTIGSTVGIGALAGIHGTAQAFMLPTTHGTPGGIIFTILIMVEVIFMVTMVTGVMATSMAADSTIITAHLHGVTTTTFTTIPPTITTMVPVQ